ncbi:hypothetical protein WAZ07_18995 [Bacillus sp. FJAT-51639]|uniref:Uncharacterized protein n=1 Tax=Bacillus bruguierae TaxID=3127667 RepID=A0ABU8FKU7_9BACI
MMKLNILPFSFSSSGIQHDCHLTLHVAEKGLDRFYAKQDALAPIKTRFLCRILT